MATSNSRKVLSVMAVLAAQVPDGWQVEKLPGKMSMFGDTWDEDGRAAVRYTRGDVVVVLNIAPIGRDRWSKYDRERAFLGCKVEGDTLLDGGSFIRRGIDVACCWLVSAPEHWDEAGHVFGAVDFLLRAQLVRCEKVKARRSTAVPVPGLPFSVQPEWFTTTATALAAGKAVSLLPHGMGTGYSLSKGRPGPWDKRATPELEAKLGVSPITIRQLDCD